MHKSLSTTVIVGGLLAGAVSSQAGPSVKMNGKTVSTNVRTINGQAFVSLTDMAKAMGMVVVKKGDGSYEIKKAGGANPIKGLNGSIGSVLFDGKWRFQLLSVTTAQKYTMKTSSSPSTNLYASSDWDAATQTLTAKANYKLVILQCRVTNGQKTKQELWTAPTDDKMNTALTDMNGGSFPPIAYDYLGGPMHTQALLPGAIITFPLLFGVPQDTRLKDLIFTLENRDYFDKGNDLRISLGQGTQTGFTSTSTTPTERIER